MLDAILSIISWVVSLHPAILIVLAIILFYIAMKVVKMVMRIVLIAIIFAALPVLMFMMGFEVAITFSSIIGSMVFGIVIYFAYHSVRTGYRVLRFILSPFRRFFRDKPKQQVIVKEVPVEKKK